MKAPGHIHASVELFENWHNPNYGAGKEYIFAPAGWTTETIICKICNDILVIVRPIGCKELTCDKCGNRLYKENNHG